MTIDQGDNESKKVDSANQESHHLAPSQDESGLLSKNGLHEAAFVADTDPRPILILVNPYSGRGKSMKILKRQVLKILTLNDVKHDIFVSTDMRVRQYLLSKSLEELTKYRTIMVVSGDGLLYEAVNAIMARQDWKEAISVPVGAIPTGSGNGLAYTLLNTSRMIVKSQAEAVTVCCEQIIRAEKCPCDLVRLSYGKETIWSFLSIGWGLLADIDIDSEWLRFFGEFRFTIYGVLRSLTSVSYKGRLSIKLPHCHQNEEQMFQLNERLKSESDAVEIMNNDTCGCGEEQIDSEYSDVCKTGSEWVHIEDKFACLYAVHQPYVNSTTNFSPRSSLTDQLTYLTYIRGSLNIYQVIEFLLAIEDGSHEKLPYVRVVPVQSFKFQPLQPSKVVVDGEVIPWTVADGPILVTVVPKLLNLSWSMTHNEAD